MLDAYEFIRMNKGGSDARKNHSSRSKKRGRIPEKTRRLSSSALAVTFALSSGTIFGTKRRNGAARSESTWATSFYTNEDYRVRFNRRGKKRLVAAKAVPVGTRSVWEQIAPLETKAASEIPLYNAIAEETGLKEDLTAVWGKDKATAAISIASHWLNTGSNAAYLYESWAQSRFVPYPEAITSKQMSELFRELKNTPNWRKDFFGARIKRLQDKEMLSFDATQIASQATEISYAQYGVGKEGGYQRQVGLILLVGHESHTPVLFRILPGNITDVTTVQDMLFRFDEITDSRRIFGAVVDRGYFSLANLARFSDAGSRIVMAAKTDASWIRHAIGEAMPHLWTNAARIAGDKCWGKTIAVEPTFEDGKKRRLWVHVYRTDGKAEQENSAFYEGLEAFEKQWIH